MGHAREASATSIEVQLLHDIGRDAPVVSEVYSPPRVTEAARLRPDLGIAPGFALDLTTYDEHGVKWDFDVAERRQAAREKVKKEKPLLLIGSTMCTRFCAWQHVNDQRRTAEEVRRDQVRALVHLRFVCELYREQMNGRRYFLHEHPEGALSWAERCIKEISEMQGVQHVVGDQCQYGQAYEGEPVRKPTGWLGNSPEVAKTLVKRCTGQGGACSRRQGGWHRSCSGPVAKAAQVYPRRLCEAILQGFRSQMIADGRLVLGVVGLQMPEEQIEGRTLEQACAAARDPMIKLQAHALEASAERPSIELNAAKKDEEAFRDAITGQPLRAEMVRAARREELE